MWAPLEFGTKEICVTTYETLLPQIWGTPFSASRGACACSRQAGVTGSEPALPQVYAVVVGHPRDDNPATTKRNQTTLHGQRIGCKGGSLLLKGWCSNKDCRLLHPKTITMEYLLCPSSLQGRGILWRNDALSPAQSCIIPIPSCRLYMPSIEDLTIQILLWHPVRNYEERTTIW